MHSCACYGRKGVKLATTRMDGRAKSSSVGQMAWYTSAGQMAWYTTVGQMDGIPRWVKWMVYQGGSNGVVYLGGSNCVVYHGGSNCTDTTISVVRLYSAGVPRWVESVRLLRSRVCVPLPCILYLSGEKHTTRWTTLHSLGHGAVQS